MAIESDRTIPIAGIGNLRDLGGYAIAAGGATRWRTLLRSGRLPTDGDPRPIADLLAMGVSTVIDLRSPHETAFEPNPLAGRGDVDYRNVPLFDALAPIAATWADGTAFNLAGRYRDAVDRCGETIAEALSAMAAADERGVVLFHCTAGKDRTGIVAALLLSLAGVNRETVADDYALTASVAGPLLGSLRDMALARGADPALVDEYLACPPETMRSLLDHLDETHHEVEAYLSEIELDKADVARLKMRLRGPA